MDKGKSYVEDATGLIELGHELCEHKRRSIGSIKRDFRLINVMSIGRVRNANVIAETLQSLLSAEGLQYKRSLVQYAGAENESHCCFGNWRSGCWPSC